MTGDTQMGQNLDALRDSLAEAIVDRHHRLFPDFDDRYGESGRLKFRTDAVDHLSYLSRALAASAPALFHEYVAWAKAMQSARGTPSSDLAANLQVMADVLQERLAPYQSRIVCRHIQDAIAALPSMDATPPSPLLPSQPLIELARAYIAALLAARRQQARQMILDAVDGGTSIKDIYMHVLQKSQEEIGRLWQINRISVAQEHYCTAITQMIMCQLYPRIVAGPRVGRRFVGACVGGDPHELGMRMVADFFELDGWDTDFLGPSLPAPDLIRFLKDRKPDVVGISVTITPHLAAAARQIADIRAQCGNIIILVGGHPFTLVPNLWRQLGADGTSPTARDVVNVANQLLLRKAAR